MQRLKPGLVCLSWLILASAVSAQTAVDPNSESGVAKVQNYSGGGILNTGGLLNGTYLDVRQVIGDGVGWQNSYSQLGLFTPFWVTENSIIAPNVRLIVTNSTQTGVNAGLVGRTYVESLDRIFGVYGYYDNDQDAYNFRYNQGTIGAETLGNWFDARANGYFVSGNNNNFIAPIPFTSNPLTSGNLFYTGHYLALNAQTLRDQAYSGVDGEIGSPLSPYAKWLRGYVGAYGYQAGGTSVAGFRGRVEATVSNDLTFGVMVTNDPLFGTNINGMIDFKFSGFLPTRYFPNWTTKQRMLNPVQRNWRIATHTYNENVQVDVINPATGKPYFITHYNASNTSPGNGTSGNPYSTFQSSPQADILLVHGGNTSTLPTALQGSAVLTNNQRLLGDGIISTAPGTIVYGGTTFSGNVVLPQTNNSGNLPFVTNSAGNNIVTLASNNEVAGLNLVGSNASAIVNNPVNGSSNFYLHDLEIAQNSGFGVFLTNASGSGVLTNINSGTTNYTNPNGIGNNALGGIQISTGAPGLNLQLTNVFMNSSPPGSQAEGISLAAVNGPLNATLTNVSASGNAFDGIDLSETNQSLMATLNNVTANNNGMVGINVSGTGGSIGSFTNRMTGTNVTAMNNGSDNLEFGTQAAPITNATVFATFTDSNFSGSTGGSGVVFSQSGGMGILNLTADPVTNAGSVVTGNNLDGLDIFGSNSAVMISNIQNGNFSGNLRDNFHVEESTGANVTLNVDPTNASSAGRDGLYYSLTGVTTVLNANFAGTSTTSNSLNNSGTSAVYGLMTSNATANLNFSYTTGANSGANGFYLNAASGSYATVTVTNGSFANSGLTTNGSASIDVVSNDSTVILNTTATPGNNPNSPLGSQTYGMNLNITNGSTFNSTITNGNFTYNLSDAVNFNVANSAAFLTLLGTSSDNSGGNGFNGTVSGNSVATINLQSGNGVNSTINSSALNGINFAVTGGTLNINGAAGTSISNNGTSLVNGSGNGILGTVTSDGANVGFANLAFTNSTINSNYNNGVMVTTTPTGGLQGNVNGTFNGGTLTGNGTAAGTGNDGILFSLNDSTHSSLTFGTYNNGSTTSATMANGNGNDGVQILATNGTIFNGLFTSSTFTNNGALTTAAHRAGFDVSTTDSYVSLDFVGVTMGNTGAGTTQQIGYLGTEAVTSTNGAQLNTIISNSSVISGNSKQGIEITASGSKATANFQVGNSTVNSNGFEGLQISSSNDAVVSYRSFSTSYDSNGAKGTAAAETYNGITASVTGTGPTDTTTAVYLLFEGGSANTNTGNGVYLNPQGTAGSNGGTMTAEFDNGFSASNNGVYGIGLPPSVAGTGINFNLIMNGTNTFTGNGSGPIAPVVFNFNNSGQAVFQVSGTFNNSTADGLHFDLENITNALVSVTGSATTVNNSADNGIYADFVNDTYASLYVNGIASINGSGTAGVVGSKDGIQAIFNNVANGAFDVEGPTTINTSGGDGINLTLTNNTNLVNGLNSTGGSTATIKHLTAIDNLSENPPVPVTQLASRLPIPVTTTLVSTVAPTYAFNIDNITANQSGGNGISITTSNNSTIATAFASDGGFGSYITNNTITNSVAGDGILISTNGGSINNMQILGNTITGNSTNGIDLQLTNMTTGSNPLGVTGLTIGANTGTVTGANSTVAASTISTNGLDGIRFDLNSSALNSLAITTNTIKGNGTKGTGNGIEFTSSTTGAIIASDITNANFTGNTITTNTGSGILLTSSTPGTSNEIITTFTNNNISTNTQAGVSLNLTQGTQDLTASFATNIINGNGFQGVNIAMGTGTAGTGVTLDTSFTGNTINGNSSDGIALALGSFNTFTDTAFYGNTIGIAAAPNGGLGVDLTVPNNSSFNWTLGDTTQAANLITGNAGAGVGILITATSTPQLTDTLNVANTTISNTTAGANVNYNGQGLAVIEQGNATLQGSITASTFTNNAGDGAFLSVTGNDLTTFSSIQNFTVGSLTNSSLGNTFNSNRGNGLEFIRTANGVIGTSGSPIEIGYNTFDSNTQSGLAITAANANATDYYNMNNNDFSKNTQNGINFSEQADAQINANMTLNTIENNGSNGILLTEAVNAPTDHRSLLGTWTLNTITGNSGNGIDIAGATNGLLIGDASNTTLANTISNNKLNGVLVTGAGSLTIGSNVIESNGTLANLGTAAENAGIMFDVAPTSTVTAEHNTIMNNFGDGVQYQIATGFAGAVNSGTVFIDNNQIEDNSGRGVNLINRGDDHTQADISGNFIAANSLEGVYIVNTASTDQTIWASSTTPLLFDGNIQNAPYLALRIVDNQIIGNGLNSTLSATGLVIRIGSAQSINTVQGTFDGGYAQGNSTTATPLVVAYNAAAGTNPSDGSAFFTALITNINSPGLGNNGYAAPATNTTNAGAYAGVIAQIDNNTLGGNFGNDIMFNSFTSASSGGAAAPITLPTSAGTWTNTVPPTVPAFAPTSIWSDPLSRFDLYFRGNTTDSGSFDPLGTGTGGYAAANQALVAFYNNAEPVFKSPINLNVTTPATPPPNPFRNVSRDRNATRLGGTFATLNANGFAYTSASGNNFEFPGIGPSVWRVSSDSIGAGGANTNAVFTSGVNVNTANNGTAYGAGVYLGGSVVPDETSYIYGFFP